MAFTDVTVVVPVDFSPQSEFAVRSAMSIAADPQRLHIVHVLMPLDSISPGVLLGDVSDKKRTEAVKTNMDKLAREQGAVGAKEVVLFGDPGLQIADYARSVEADLIVIPSHGYHGIKRFVLGSVAERVIRHAECSVLVLRRSDAE
ncbi:MAG: universal stress protein [Planctomycetaceae bacterium]|nr:universal stress protein [Planctomycetaceae bacterium]